VLNERKYTVDYFQREYSWEQKHVEQLVTDLTSTFLDVYSEGDPRTCVEHYNNYFLGPFVVSSKNGMKSIIDGQQRLNDSLPHQAELLCTTASSDARLLLGVKTAVQQPPRRVRFAGYSGTSRVPRTETDLI
jgi:hypothetical protein